LHNFVTFGGKFLIFCLKTTRIFLLQGVKKQKKQKKQKKKRWRSSEIIL